MHENLQQMDAKIKRAKKQALNLAMKATVIFLKSPTALHHEARTAALL